MLILDPDMDKGYNTNVKHIHKYKGLVIHKYKCWFFCELAKNQQFYRKTNSELAFSGYYDSKKIQNQIQH